MGKLPCAGVTLVLGIRMDLVRMATHIDSVDLLDILKVRSSLSLGVPWFIQAHYPQIIEIIEVIRGEGLQGLAFSPRPDQQITAVP